MNGKIIYIILMDKVMGYKLSHLVSDITRFKNDANNKKFTSVKQAQDTINNINSAIAQIWEHLNNKTK